MPFISSSESKNAYVMSGLYNFERDNFALNDVIHVSTLRHIFDDVAYVQCRPKQQEKRK